MGMPPVSYWQEPANSSGKKHDWFMVGTFRLSIGENGM